MQDEQSAASSDMGEDVPDWWPYAAEFPHWHVWRGVCGLVYARRSCPAAGVNDNGRRFLQELPTHRRKDYARVCSSIAY